MRIANNDLYRSQLKIEKNFGELCDDLHGRPNKQ